MLLEAMQLKDYATRSHHCLGVGSIANLVKYANAFKLNQQ
jgi:hypothetical protein